MKIDEFTASKEWAAWQDQAKAHKTYKRHAAKVAVTSTAQEQSKSPPCIHLGVIVPKTSAKTHYQCDKGHGVVCPCQNCGPQRCRDYEPDAVEESDTSREVMGSNVNLTSEQPPASRFEAEVAAALAEIRKPHTHWDKVFYYRPDYQEAHRRLWREFLDSVGEPPRRSGVGMVIAGGGRYNDGIYLTVRMLREVGSDMPVQVWHAGDDEQVNKHIRRLPGVTVIDAESHPLRSTWRTVAGWPRKHMAVIHSGFEYCFLSDADNYPVSNPEALLPKLAEVPAIVWPENGREIHWGSYGLESDCASRQNTINTGSAAFHVPRCWKALQLAHHFDMHSDWWYQCVHKIGGYGDQGQLQVALHATKTPKWKPTRMPLADAGLVLVQAGLDGKTPMWVHRIAGKPGMGMKAMAHLPMEKRVWEIVREYQEIENRPKPT